MIRKSKIPVYQVTETSYDEFLLWGILLARTAHIHYLERISYHGYLH